MTASAHLRGIQYTPFVVHQGLITVWPGGLSYHPGPEGHSGPPTPVIWNWAGLSIPELCPEGDCGQDLPMPDPLPVPCLMTS